MAKRFTATEKWDKAWFRNLRPRHKALWQYLCDRCDLAGMWEIDYESASHYVNDEVKITETDLKVFGDRIEKYSDEKIWIVGFVSFQNGELSDKCAAHKPIFKLLNKYRLSDRVSNRVSDTLKEKGIVIEKGMVGVEEKGIEGGVGGLPNPTLTECEAAFQMAGSTREEGEKFFHHYQAQGWKVGNGQPITDWASLAQKWILNPKTNSNGAGAKIRNISEDQQRKFNENYDRLKPSGTSRL